MRKLSGLIFPQKPEIMPLTCPRCHSHDIKQHYQLHIGYYEPENRGLPVVWTTRKFRSERNIGADRGQILIVPPIDETWMSCNMCGVEFDDNGEIYRD